MNLEKILSFVFFLSGFSALIYQVVWQRLLTLYYGVGAVSITLIVSVYLAGLGIGSLLGGHLIERVKRKVNFYFLLEFLIGCFGIVSIHFLKYVGERTAGADYRLAFLFMSLFLLLPTTLMGMTLPALTKIFNGIIHDFKKTVSFLYFINTLGAALGAIISSYVLITFGGFDTAVYTAAGINFILAALIFGCRGREPSLSYKKEPAAVKGKPFVRLAFVLIFVTGFFAIGFEMIWFRVIGVLVKESPYAFSSILAVYLLGIALGSRWVNRYLDRHPSVDQKNLLFSLQGLLGCSILVIFLGYYYLTSKTSFYYFTDVSMAFYLHPFVKILNAEMFSSLNNFLNGVFAVFDVFWWPLFFLFLPTFLMGASFPLLSSLALSGDKEGKVIGRVYAANILGCVLGGVVTGFFILPMVGSERAILAYASLILLMGVGIARIGKIKIDLISRVLFVGALIAGSVLLFPGKGELYKLMHKPYAEKEMYIDEGVNGVVATIKNDYQIVTYLNGMSHGGYPGYRFYAIALDGLSQLRAAKDVLIIGYGTGSTTETVLSDRTVKSVALVEINRTLIKSLSRFEVFKNMLTDPRVDLIIDDGRRYLLRTDKKFDLVLIDPLRTTSSYSNNLYSKEFFELVRSHLNPEGVFVVWMDEFNILPLTLSEVFPYVEFRAWNFSAYCMASDQAMVRKDKRFLNILYTLPEGTQKEVKVSLPNRKADQKEFLKIRDFYPINTDFKPSAEYFLNYIIYQ
ncbi:MAG: hypothetical protein A2Z88_06395 [Omnitrophica WOR_2 bacterium GWA2_47_8]|nr:MAG: hypothetical protein A2Z88_06395 [Omnitrophica WOR_2 bacterium GWA2_47_8]